MFQTPYVKFLERMDIYTQINREVPAHHVQLFILRAGREKIGEITATGRVYEAEDISREFDLLERLYKRDHKSGRSYVEMAYGHPSEGRMEETMKNAMNRFLPDGEIDVDDDLEDDDGADAKAATG